jgi:hypothetical protein
VLERVHVQHGTPRVRVQQQPGLQLRHVRQRAVRLRRWRRGLRAGASLRVRAPNELHLHERKLRGLSHVVDLRG